MGKKISLRATVRVGCLLLSVEAADMRRTDG
jgi:hypothetical protein